ncbi:hypothetical protein ES703_93257 [subsurface metagenome]
MSNQAFQDVYAAALRLLSHDREGDIERLFRRILEWERNNPPTGDYPQYHGWEWFEVHGDPRTLNKLVIKEALKVTLKTNKCINYRLLDAKAVEKALNDYEGVFAQVEQESEEIPEDLFATIIEHEKKKQIFMRSLAAEKPVNLLLLGAVATAKTMFLEELRRLPHSYFALGSSMSKAGLFEILFNERPSYLILDELDKVDDQSNLSVLLSLMEGGVVAETKYRRHRHFQLTTWVFASANRIGKIPHELLSRFQPLRFKEYTLDEFYEVVTAVLHQRENTPKSLALYIAERVHLDLQSRDVRDAVHIARLLSKKTKKDVDFIVDILKEQK